jgi:cell division transport system permease protein
MFIRRTDLSLERDAQDKFLPWLVSFMVFLAVLAFALAAAVHQVAGRWDKGARGTLTVQVPADESADGSAGEARLAAVLALLRATPGIASAEPLADEELAALIEPWVGRAAVGDIPMPRLIDARTVPGAAPDLDLLRARLATVAPGAVVDDHRAWLGRLLALMRAIEWTALAVLGFVLAVTVGTVIFTTRTGLSIHQEAIEVMHLIGARDSYVARQFADRALALGLRGGAIGLLLAIPALAAIGALFGRESGGALPEVTFSLLHWAAIGSMPILVALTAMGTARVTVHASLARMM